MRTNPGIAHVTPASAVVIVREAPRGPELLFMKRSPGMRFLAGFHAFPGGSLHPGDGDDEAAALSALSVADARAAMGADADGQPAIAFFVCALRELFEETGLLLAYRSGVLVDPGEPAIVAARQRLLSSDHTFLGVLRGLGLTLATDLLRYHERWLAPEALPVRFDLRVFVGPLVGTPDAFVGEVERLDWHSPAEILALAETGEVMLAPPTMATISSLVRYATAQDMVSGEAPPVEAAKVERLSPSVRRIVAPNASLMTGPGSNTYLVGDEEMIVIDPGSMERSHLEAIVSSGSVGAIVVTHGHADHMSGALDLSDMTGVPIAASHRFWERSALSSRGRRVGDGDRISAGGRELEVIDTPGHSSDHIGLWFAEERALFSGDLILGQATTVISPPDGNLTDYLASLDKVARLEPERIYPGHFGPRDDAGAWIAWYIEHRRQREQQIIEALRAGPASAGQIVAMVYTDVDPSLHPIAERSVLAHLQKLIAEGAVVEDAGGYRFIL